jgi:Protein of unknown function (DUF3106)
MSTGTAAMRMLRPFLLSAALLVAATGAQGAAPPKQAPAWAELNAEQQRILAPLAKDWDQLEPARKRKWVGVAGRYPTMSQTEQARVQRRMQAWAKLTPEQRRQARESYRNLSKLPPEKKQDLKQQWAEYQSLAPEERRKLDAPPAEPKPAERKRTTRKPAAPNPAPSPQTQPSGK